MLIKIKVATQCKKEYVDKVGADSYLVGVKEAAKNNAANKKIIELFKEMVPGAKRVRIMSGHHRSSKILSVD